MFSQGPTAIAPGGILSYTFILTNTNAEPLSSLMLVDTLPPSVQVLKCAPDCAKNSPSEVGWRIPSISAGQSLNYILQLRLNDIITDETFIDNTITLLNAGGHPINVSTLTTTITTATFDPHAIMSPARGDFFALPTRAVAETDGLVLETVSPWNQQRAILIVTGLDDETVQKAGRAMSSSNLFPGVSGSFSLVRRINPPLEVEPTVIKNLMHIHWLPHWPPTKRP